MASRSLEILEGWDYSSRGLEPPRSCSCLRQLQVRSSVVRHGALWNRRGIEPGEGGNQDRRLHCLWAGLGGCGYWLQKLLWWITLQRLWENNVKHIEINLGCQYCCQLPRKNLVTYPAMVNIWKSQQKWCKPMNCFSVFDVYLYEYTYIYIYPYIYNISKQVYQRVTQTFTT